MRLVAELLLGALKERFSIADYEISGACPPFGRPLLYTGGQKIEPGRLYLTDSPDAVLCQGGICTVYANGARPLRRDGSFICLAEDLSCAFNAVQEVFDLIDDWDAQLQQVLLKHGSLQELLYAARSLLVNPILVMDMDFTLVAQSGEEEVAPTQRLFDSHSNSLELSNALRQDKVYIKMLEEREPYLYPAHILGWSSLNMNIFQGDQLSHRLVLVEHLQPLSSGDSWLLRCLTPYVDSLLKLERPDYQSDNRLRALLMRVLSDRTADYMEVSRQLTHLNWGPEEEYFCLVLKLPQSDRQGTSSNQIRNYLKKQYPASCSCTYNEDIVTFFNTTKLGKSLGEVAEDLKYFIRECILKAGYSRAMCGHDNLRRQYIQAQAAIETGGRINPYQWIHHFDNISLNFLLEESMHRLPGNMLCHEKLLALREYDRREGTEYMHTLRVYLDQNLNAVQSAKTLYIHRSTLLYRLEKIKKILECSLSDPDEVLYLSLSFRLFQNEAP